MKDESVKKGHGPLPPEKKDGSERFPRKIAYWVCRECRYFQYAQMAVCPQCGTRRIKKRDITF